MLRRLRLLCGWRRHTRGGVGSVGIVGWRARCCALDVGNLDGHRWGIGIAIRCIEWDGAVRDVPDHVGVVLDRTAQLIAWGMPVERHRFVLALPKRNTA